jgi:hypothetical protein
VIAVGTILRAPLLWFVLAGAGFFVLDSLRQDETLQTITITAGDIQRLRDQWSTQSGASITDGTLDGLIEELILERRLSREARALGLDQEDVVVQRRLAQKMRFLSEAFADEAAVDEADLAAFFQGHRNNYQRLARFTFRHVFLDREKHGADTEASSAELLQILRRSTTTQWRALGDPHILGQSFKNRSTDEIRKGFGNRFVEQLSLQPLKNWQGPLQSNSGIHLVFIERHQEPHLLTLADVRDLVLYDYRKEQRKLAFLRYQVTLAEKYPVIMDVEL